MLLFNRPILLLTRHYFVTNLRSTVHSIDSKFTCLRRCSQHSLQAHCRLKSPSVHMFIKDLKNIYTKQFSPLARFISRLPQCLPATTTLPAGCLATCLIFYYHASRNVECAAKHAKSRLAGRSDPSDLPDPPFDWKAFREILLPEIWYLIAAVVSALAVAVVNINIPLLMGELVDAVSKFTAQTAKSFMDEVKKPVMKLIIIYSIQAVLTFFYISLLSTLGERVALTLKKQLFASLLSQDIAFFDKHKTGELIDRLTTDIQDFKSSFKLCISQGLRSVTQTVGCVVSLLLMSVKLTGVMLIVVPAIIVGGTLLGTSLRRLSKAAQDQVAKATAVAAEAVGNVRTVRAFAMEDKENELHGQQVEEACKLNIQLGIGIGIFQGLANLALNGIVLGTIFAGGWMLSVSELTAGDLMSFLVATQTIERSLAQMSLLFGQVVRGLGAGARVFEYINTKPEIPLKGGEKMHRIQGNIEFSDVSFSYPARPDQVVLHNFSLSVPGGGVVALVGLSGGGKSTVAALLERFYDVSEGKITLDGRDIRELDPTWLRGQAIGFINQEPVLFATTVMENIRYGRPDATDDEVMKAAELANAHDFVSQFPQGYNTVLGERGVTVSGGQKQRIAIARALIKNPSILVLDEATSALDAESERVVQEALDKVIKDRTVIVIAHRLSTIRNADMIAVVSNGKIVEKGTHRVLKKKKGLYWELIRKQELEEEILVHEKHTESEGF